MQKILSRTLLATALTFSAHAMAQSEVSWPTKPVQVIVPAGAGGDTDFNARQMARYFEKITGKPMIITNVNGGGGTIAMSQVRDGASDGSMLFFGHTGQLIVTEVSGLIDYNFEAFDISCIPAIDKGMVFVASKKSGFKTVQEVVSQGKAMPGSVIYGTELGGYSHLQALMFQKQAGIEMKIVDTGSASDKITSLLGGRIALSTISFGPIKDYVATGAMSAVAQYSKDANPLLGDIKTFAEQGIDLDMNKSYVIAFKKGTDPAIVKKMADVMQQITKDPAYAKALEEGFKQPVSFIHTKEAIAKLQQTRNEYMQFKDLLRQKK